MRARTLLRPSFTITTCSSAIALFALAVVTLSVGFAGDPDERSAEASSRLSGRRGSVQTDTASPITGQAGPHATRTDPASTQPNPEAAQTDPAVVESVSTPSASVPIIAAGRGNPYVNYKNARPLPADFPGSSALSAALSDLDTKGLALASADFDEDGMPDLVASYATASGGLLSLHFGNVDAVYPNAPEAKERKAKGTFVDAPFLPDAKILETPERPDFIGAGDFDADGHKDVVTASAGGSTLLLHRGDGDGTLQHLPERYPLPGAVTFMTIGDVNLRDGMEDILVGVLTQAGPRLLVFEAAGAAFGATPEMIDLPAPATDIVTGHMDAEFPVDMAVAAGRHLVFVAGRIRKLDWPEDLRTGVGITVGGGTVGYPQNAVGFKSDPGYLVVTGSNAIQTTSSGASRFGDYFSVRPVPGTGDFALEAYDVLQDVPGQTCRMSTCSAFMRYVEFGRPGPF